VRLIRRIVRDIQKRGNDALATISMWQSVRRGEQKNVFPYSNEADHVFNRRWYTNLPY
jgi:uridine kinase